MQKSGLPQNLNIYSAEQIRKWDAFTIKNEPITSLDLMERASQSFVNVFCKKFSNKNPVFIFCGLGNNGGDGLAIARLLHLRGYFVEVFIVRFAEKYSEDFAHNHQRLGELLSIHEIRNSNQIPKIPLKSIVIDAIFGSGLSRSIQGIAKKVILKLNELCTDKELQLISVDIASGLFADKSSEDQTIIRPDWTISFQSPKLAFLLPQNEQFVGNWEAIPIGLDERFKEQEHPSYQLITESWIKSKLKKRSKFSHKGTFGRGLLIAGSYGKVGAAVLALKGALKSGIGLLTIQAPKCAYEILQTTVSEAMVISDGHPEFISKIEDSSIFDAVAIGCGLGKEMLTVQALKNFLKNHFQPMVLDADALNILAENPEFLNDVPHNSILTPHPKEFERLVGKAKNDFERLDLLKEFTQKHRVFVVLKGTYTAIASPEGMIYFNATGNPGMATGGSGDVLTGILLALLTQGYSSLETTLLGVFFHGKAGDLALEQESQESLLPSDLIQSLGMAFKNSQ